jgi:Carboxypeptidase regulatory-like domain
MMNTSIRTCVILFSLFVLSSCSGYKTPVAPSAVSLAGTVTAQDGARLAGATVRVVDGVNAGKSTTTNNEGVYRFDDLTAGIGNVTAAADDYDSVTTSSHIDGTAPLNFTLRSSTPWSTAGIGSAVFDMPSYVTRVRIIGVNTGVASDFIVRVGACTIVDDRLGVGQFRTLSDGTYLVTEAGNPPPPPPTRLVKIVSSPGLSWSLTEDRASGVGTPCFLD